MREVGLGIADPLYHGNRPAVVQRLEAGQARVEAEPVIDVQDLLLGDGQRGTVLIVAAVAVGDERVEAVVAAGQLHHHQDAAGRVARPGGQHPIGQPCIDHQAGGDAGDGTEAKRPPEKLSA